ncbi:2TM domain-containing protein [Flavobacterium sp.]|uniref:2TM domain-containing protein n=1 Tax=Flavobacterium sp. TaxID=239 RepID=UPI00286C9265|nr:2TM domain-containing protein [Flavobacterium sp.]
MENLDEIRYQEALKRVKKIKGFYTHLIVFIVVNIMIIIVNIQNLKAGESYFHWHNFTTVFFWGIGLLGHALSVFLPTVLLGKNWEEKKIKQLMDQEKNNKWE